MKKIDELITPGWANLKEIKEYLEECKIEFVKKGDTDNMYDGREHEIYKAQDGEIFDFIGNRWSGETYRPLLEWAEKKRG